MNGPGAHALRACAPTRAAHTRRAHTQMHLAFIFIAAQARKQLLSFPTWHGPPCHSRSLKGREGEIEGERGRA